MGGGKLEKYTHRPCPVLLFEHILALEDTPFAFGNKIPPIMGKNILGAVFGVLSYAIALSPYADAVSAYAYGVTNAYKGHYMKTTPARRL